jgi:hypothetical protein
MSLIWRVVWIEDEVWCEDVEGAGGDSGEEY